MKISQLFAIASLASFSATAFGEVAIPKCSAVSGATSGLWNLTLNLQDRSTKDDILKVIQVLGSEGFSMTSSFASKDAEIFMKFSFNAERFADKKTSDKLLRNGLEALVAMEGVQLDCAPVYSPRPAITIRN